MKTDPDRDDRDIERLIRALKAEPYAEPGAARLEFERRRLVARLQQGGRATDRRLLRRVAMVGAAAAAVLAASVFGFVLVRGAPNDAQGQVSLAGAWRLASGDIIARGAPVVVPAGERAELALPDGTALWLGPDTRLALEEGEIDRVRLASGELVARVTPRRGGTFEVVTPEAVISVHGTTFAVSARGGTTTVRLHQGEISLTSHGRTISVAAGKEVVASDRGVTALKDVGTAAALSDLRLAGQETWPSWLPRPGADPDLAVSAVMEEPREAATDRLGPVDETLASSAMETLESPPSEIVRPRSVASSRKTPPPSVIDRIKELYRARAYAEVVDLTAGANDHAEALYYRARSLQDLGLWLQAAETYLTLAKADPARRGEVTYLAAAALARTPDLERSLALAEEAVAAGGPNADHAQALKIQVLSGLKRYPEATAAATLYLTLFPDGAHVAEAVFARATSLRLDGRWRDAAAAYEDLLARGNVPEPLLDEAAYYRGRCLIRAGDFDLGRAALAEYVATRPEGRYVAQARADLGK